LFFFLFDINYYFQIFESFSCEKMAVDYDAYGLQLYFDVINRVHTLQDFVDSISNKIENNRVKSYLQTFLQKTQELEQFYNIENQYCSPRFTIENGLDEQREPFIFQYFIQKIQHSNHYCLYISIPANHPFNGKHYDEVPSATYCSVDEEDPRRWVFGWDYAHINMLTLTSIYMYYAANPAALLDLQIISVDTIQEDVNQYVNILVGNR
jgi:hypothetical protein